MRRRLWIEFQGAPTFIRQKKGAHQETRQEAGEEDEENWGRRCCAVLRNQNPKEGRAEAWACGIPSEWLHPTGLGRRLQGRAPPAGVQHPVLELEGRR